MNAEEDDRLSTLKDKPLTIVLSFLPIKEAAATSILSRRWRYLWTGVTAFRLKNIEFLKPKFFAMVTHCLRHLNFEKIETIELDCHAPSARIYKPSFLTASIRDIIYGPPMQVKELKINFKKSNIGLIPLPSCVFQMPSLEVLEFGSFFDFKLPDSGIRLPNLRKLVISVYDMQLLGVVSKSCSLLESLQVDGFLKTDFNHSVTIIAQNLKWLSIKLASKQPTKKESRILIDAPKLEQFDVHGRILLSFGFLKTARGLVHAKLDLGIGKGGCCNAKQGLKLARSMFPVRSLNVRGDLLFALGNVEEKNLETFHRLTHLDLVLSYRTCWIGLKCLLQYCPNAQSLVLRRGGGRWDNINWSLLEILPACLNATVRSIALWNLVGKTYEMDLIKYILDSAKGLKILDVAIDASGSKIMLENDFVQELESLSSSLPSCQINFFC